MHVGFTIWKNFMKTFFRVNFHLAIDDFLSQIRDSYMKQKIQILTEKFPREQ